MLTLVQDVGGVATVLILMSLTDKVVNCRRAGAAALQELIGRHVSCVYCLSARGASLHKLLVECTKRVEFVVSYRLSFSQQVTSLTSALHTFH
jgi:hypothetical protein